jgi:hypothetical protein
MRERVSLCGGKFTAGPLPGRGFQVVARFPLTAPPPVPPARAAEAAIAAAPSVDAIAARALPGQAR